MTNPNTIAVIVGEMRESIDCGTYGGISPQQVEQWADRLAALGDVEKDAARYRWLAENCRPWTGGDDQPHALIQICRGEMDDGMIGWFNIVGPVSRVGIITLDAAVDASMQPKDQNDD